MGTAPAPPVRRQAGLLAGKIGQLGSAAAGGRHGTRDVHVNSERVARKGAEEARSPSAPFRQFPCEFWRRRRVGLIGG